MSVPMFYDVINNNKTPAQASHWPENNEIRAMVQKAGIQILKTGYSPCCACAILFVLVDYYLSFPWFPVRLRNIRAILYLLIQGVGIHSFEEIFNDL